MERNKVGLFGFYCAGIPAWTVSFIVSVCRNHFLEPALDYIHGKVSALFDNDTYKSSIRRVFKGVHLRYLPTFYRCELNLILLRTEQLQIGFFCRPWTNLYVFAAPITSHTTRACGSNASLTSSIWSRLVNPASTLSSKIICVWYRKLRL